MDTKSKKLEIKDIIKRIDFKKISPYIDVVIDFFRDKSNSGKFLFFVAIIAFGLAIYFVVNLLAKIKQVNDLSNQITSLITYDTSSFGSKYTKDVLGFSNSINDLVIKNKEIKDAIVKYNSYIKDMNLPYDNFLKYLMFPSLNIWRDVYTKKVDVSMVGEKFLTNNPYDNIYLLQKWTNFFKDVGTNEEFNEIEDISLGDIREDSDGLFIIPVDVSFTANSKRSFLMLVDKLSMTSNKSNLELLNEFFYFLWQEIKIQKMDVIGSGDVISIGSGSDVITGDVDFRIGYMLYNWVYGSGKNDLVDDAVIESTIKNLMSCEDDLVVGKCYYKFRDKYRDLAGFSYAVSKDVTPDILNGFRNYLKNMPPVLMIKDFSFDKAKNIGDISSLNTMKYKGKITIDLYGMGIAQDELDQIANVLGQQCFGEQQPISVSKGLDVLNAMIAKQSDIIGADKSKIDDLWQLKSIFEKYSLEYDSLSNYKKIIRLFEIYRMLEDSSLCI